MSQGLKCEITVAETVYTTNDYQYDAGEGECLLAFEIGNRVYVAMRRQLRDDHRSRRPLYEIAGPLHLSWSADDYQPRGTLDLNWRFTFMSGRSFNGSIRSVSVASAGDKRRDLIAATALKILQRIQTGSEASQKREIQTRAAEIASVSVPTEGRQTPAQTPRPPHGDIERGVMSV